MTLGDGYGIIEGIIEGTDRTNTNLYFMAKVVVYSTPTCVYCKMAKDYFKEHNVAYEEKDVTIDMDAQEEMIEKSGQMGVPVIAIDGEMIIGFDQKRIAELLAIK